MSNLSKWIRLLMVLPCVALIGGFVVAMSSPNQFAAQTTVSTVGPTSTAAPICPPDCQPLIDELSQGGSLEVVVKLKAPFQPETALSDADAQAQRAAIIQAQSPLWQDDYGSQGIVYGATPYVELLINKTELQKLIAAPFVSAIRKDIFAHGTFDLSNQDWVASDWFDLGLSHLRTINTPTATTANVPNTVQCSPSCDKLYADARQGGIVRVSVYLKPITLPETITNATTVQGFQPQNAASRLAESLMLRKAIQDNINFQNLSAEIFAPTIVINATKADLDYLLNSPLVNAVSAAEAPATMLGINCLDPGNTMPNTSTPNAYGVCNTGANVAWQSNLDTLHSPQVGYTGQGQAIVIIDSGVDRNHPFFLDSTGHSRVVDESCYAAAIDECPNGTTSEEDITGAARPCTYLGCHHGTFVAGIAAGQDLNSNDNPGSVLSGVAINSPIIAIQIFHRIVCQGCAPCHQLGAQSYNIYTCATFDLGDLDNALAHVLKLAQNHQYSIAAVNLSIGTSGAIDNGTYSSPCENNPKINSLDPNIFPLVEKLRLLNIAVIAASGNDNSTSGMAFPACLSNVISVGAVNAQDQFQMWIGTEGTDRTTGTNLLAPGVAIWSSSTILTGTPASSATPTPVNTPAGGYYKVGDGTSYAAPFVTGAWALLKQRDPNATVDQILAELRSVGVRITDPATNIVYPRLQVDAGLRSWTQLFDFTKNQQGVVPFVSSQSIPQAYYSVGVGFIANYSGQPNSIQIAHIPFRRSLITSAELISGASDLGSSAQLQLCEQAINAPCYYTTPAPTSVATPNPADLHAYVQYSPTPQTMANAFISYNNSVSIITPVPTDQVIQKLILNGMGRNPFLIGNIGVYRPSTSTFYLRNTNSTGPADFTIPFGISDDQPIVGDWTGFNIDTIGIYRPSNGTFYLRNTNTSGSADETFVFGNPNGGYPLAGRWTLGALHDGIGLFNPSNGLIYLRNALTTGYADYTMLLGVPGDEGLVGDWNNKGYDTPGVYRPSSGKFYLSDQLCTNSCSLSVDFTFLYGSIGGAPLANGWTGNGQVGVGLFNSGTFYLRNTVNTGIADNSFAFGQAQDIPLAGHWIADNTLVNPFLSPVPTYTPSGGGGDRPAILISPTPPIYSPIQPAMTLTPNSLGD